MDISKVIKGVGTVVSAFNPVVGGAVVMAGSLADGFDGVPDENLENNFIGFEKSSEIIKEIINRGEFTDLDKEKLLDVAKNLDGMNKLMQKFTKIFK